MTVRPASPLAYHLANVSKNVQLGENTITILKNINLQISQGEYVSIIGPSGSGKSTLMHLLGCLDHPTDGSISVFGRMTALLSDDDLAALRSQTFGFVFQAFHLLASYDLVSNVALPMVYCAREDRAERAASLLEQLGLGHRLSARPRTLSGGEQQRVAIARAVANNPSILLADEPTGSLDQANGRAILERFGAFHAQGKTIVLVTHDIAVAKHAERIIEIVDGVIRSDHRAR